MTNDEPDEVMIICADYPAPVLEHVLFMLNGSIEETCEKCQRKIYFSASSQKMVSDKIAVGEFSSVHLRCMKCAVEEAPNAPIQALPEGYGPSKLDVAIGVDYDKVAGMTLGEAVQMLRNRNDPERFSELNEPES